MKKDFITLCIGIFSCIFVSTPLYSATFYRFKIDEKDVTELNKLGSSFGLSDRKGWPVTSNEAEKIEIEGITFINTDTLKRTEGTDLIVTYVQKVKGIYFDNKGLKGTLPALTFSELTHITFNQNNISGNIPDLQLPKCIWLILANNQFTGSIPDFNLPLLESLSLQNNKLTGQIPNFKMPSLRHLLLSENQFQGSLPNFNLPKLEMLNAYNNQLSGNLPAYNFPELYHLDLQNNQISGPVPVLVLPKAVNIFLNSNKLSGSIPDLNFPVLQELYLQKNSFDGTIGKINAPKLRILDASDNKLTGNFDNSLMASLSHLKLNNNNISGLPKLSTSSPNITLVQVTGCRLTFEDFEPNMDFPIFNIDNQQKVDTYEGLIGISKILYVKVGGTKNKYQWIKGKDGKSSEIPGATNDTLLVTPEAGVSFMCRITNDIVRTVTFYSKPVTPSMCLKVGVFEFCLEKGEWKPKSLNTLETDGRVSVNNTFIFEGTMSIDTLNLDMKAVGDFYFRNIPLPGGTHGNYMISQGEHNLKLLGKDGIITNFLNSKLKYTAELFNIPVKIDSLQLVKRSDTLGVRISSTIEIPFLYRGCGPIPDNTEIRLKNYEVTNHGRRLNGLEVENLGLIKEDFCLKNITYDYDWEKNILTCGTEITFPILLNTLGGGFKLKNGQIDSIALLVEWNKPIPIKPPGLALKGVYGHIAGLTKANSLLSQDLTKMDFKLGGILSPVLEKLENLIKLNVDGRIFYPKLAEFSAKGNLFKPPEIDDLVEIPYQVSLTGKLLWKIPEARFDLDFNGSFGTMDEKNYLMDITGKGVIECVYSPVRITVNEEGVISLPKISNNYPFNWLDSYFDFPIKLGIASFMSSQEENMKRGVVYFQPFENQKYELGYVINYSKPVLSSGYITFSSEIDPGIYLNNKSSNLITETLKTFTIENNTSFMVIEVKSPQKAPGSTLKDPSGKIYNTTNQGDKVLFSKSSNETEAFWSVLAPKPGNWTITLDNMGNSDSVIVYRQLQKEEFNFNVTQSGKTITVQWDTIAVKNGKYVSFFFDDDMTGFNGSLVAEGNAKAGKLSFTIQERFTKCKYYISGKLTGDYWQSEKYSDKPVDNQNTILAPPANFKSSYNKSTGMFDFTWSNNPSATVSGYVITVKDESGRDSVYSVISSNRTSVSLLIKDFETKKVIIESYNSDGNTGCTSEAVKLTTGIDNIQLDNRNSSNFEVYPNPSGEVCTIRFFTRKFSKCTVTVFDINGRKIGQPVNGIYTEGMHQTVFRYGNLPHGIYLFRFTNNDESQVVKSVFGK